jgi:hypothetical protein
MPEGPDAETLSILPPANPHQLSGSPDRVIAQDLLGIAATGYSEEDNRAVLDAGPLFRVYPDRAG